MKLVTAVCIVGVYIHVCCVHVGLPVESFSMHLLNCVYLV